MGEYCSQFASLVKITFLSPFLDSNKYLNSCPSVFVCFGMGDGYRNDQCSMFQGFDIVFPSIFLETHQLTKHPSTDLPHGKYEYIKQ